MRARGTAPARVHVVTLGCSKNTVDSENLVTQLKAGNIPVTHGTADKGARIWVVNTCGFVEQAKQESIDTILGCIDAKEAGQIDKLYVTGCLSHRYRDQLEEEMPQVDAFFGTMELPRLLKTLGADYRHELLGERLISTPRHTAFMKIAEGCNRPCAFCAIPLMRGRHVSRPIEELVNEAQNLAKKGVKELVLIAQDLTYYGLDLYGSRRLSDLLVALAQTSGIKWIRLQYAYPSQFPTDILPIMRDVPTICRYLDMPLQHASDPMLRQMRRGITAARTEHLLDEIRRQVPGIHLRTTLISGFPGESNADHATLMKFVARQKFDRLGVFTYSHEENTAAYNLTDDVPAALKEERMEEIMALQQEISQELNEQKIGQVLTVLMERRESGFWVGRTEFDSPEVDNEVLVDAEACGNIEPGTFVPIRITAAEAFDLYGVPVHDIA
ncbi:MAG: 30S ribosomal protein S12 methylthiotransferase RimO [Bacteroidetes bacterium]|nr:30S ribosomal protein S12 methylthiotransferase RimO [Bacteroidota bacterium]